MRVRGLALAGLVVFAGCTTTPRQAEQAAQVAADDEAALATELAGLVPGEETACLPTPTRVQTSSRGFGRTLVYRVSRDIKYRNDTTGGCEAVSRGSFFVTRTPLSRVCKGDIVQTFDPQSRVPTGGCALGSFVAYRRP